ncbi:DinB family protein [Brevibacterium atlanticum]|uniref:DinB family protein n=1 Tax=Brevibacterium atlanticum TaxID=2697563 RepID=UPI001AA169F9
MTTRRLLQRQFEIAWGLLDYHLERMNDEDLHWRVAPVVWDIHRAGNEWVPDFAETEPDPVPVPTVAWVTWHIDWWWSTAHAHLTKTPPPTRDQIGWPGAAEAVKDRLRGLRREWATALSGCADLDQASAYPWPIELGYSAADMCAWVNVELTKNAAELGQTLMIRAVSPR